MKTQMEVTKIKAVELDGSAEIDSQRGEKAPRLSSDNHLTVSLFVNSH